VFGVCVGCGGGGGGWGVVGKEGVKNPSLLHLHSAILEKSPTRV